MREEYGSNKQTNKQTKNKSNPREKKPNEMEISNLPDKEFKDKVIGCSPN